MDEIWQWVKDYEWLFWEISIPLFILAGAIVFWLLVAAIVRVMRERPWGQAIVNGGLFAAVFALVVLPVVLVLSGCQWAWFLARYGLYEAEWPDRPGWRDRRIAERETAERANVAREDAERERLASERRETERLKRERLGYLRMKFRAPSAPEQPGEGRG